LKVFIDTNAFVYANDSRYPAKQRIAIDLVKARLRAADTAISTQVIMEYASTARTKLRQPLEGIIRQLNVMERFEVVSINGALVRDALVLSAESSISWWDAVIVSAARAAGCTVLVTEDLSPSTSYGKLRVENPFAGAE
jgi:predicted nucleic acid-binding protein